MQLLSKLRSKSQLIEWLAGTQVLCLAIAVVCFGSLIKVKLGTIIRDQIMAENQLIAEQMGRLFVSVQPRPVTYGDDDWERLQSLIEVTELPNDGYLCIASADSGLLICHPKIRSEPALRNSNVGLVELQMKDASRIMLQDAIRDHDELKTDVVTGLLGSGIHTEIVSVALLPQLNGVLLVHQSEASTRTAVAKLLSPLGYIGLIIGVAMIFVATKTSVAIVKRYENELARINEGLEQTVRDRTTALTKTRDAVIFGLAKLAESRDSDTGEHLERISIYATALATSVVRRTGKAHTGLVEAIGLAASLHDIGKVGIPDGVLLKPGRLSRDERNVIESHPKVGEACLNAIEERLGADGFLSMAKEICAYHHEKWDGSGYPYQLSGPSIPLSARIVAVADVYDALRSRRPYKEPMTHEQARAIIREGSGMHFDPEVVHAFFECEATFERISTCQSRSPSNRPVNPDRLFPELVDPIVSPTHVVSC